MIVIYHLRQTPLSQHEASYLSRKYLVYATKTADAYQTLLFLNSRKDINLFSMLRQITAFTRDKEHKLIQYVHYARKMFMSNSHKVSVHKFSVSRSEQIARLRGPTILSDGRNQNKCENENKAEERYIRED